ncbi:hypothetical protein [Brevibacillus sp. NRS-1366]|uniref:hypothetical protein n=1 Tax=Brevibacillus sp. NRS-1366 TaxID=3233899 RepID=UPI003D1A6D0F
MPVWMFVLAVLGGLLLVGAVFDFYNKRSKRKVNMDLKKENPLDNAYDPRNKDDHLI